MNAYTNTPEGSGLTREQRRTQFNPVFNQDGDIVGISIVENEYDEALASAAIEKWHRDVLKDLDHDAPWMPSPHTGLTPIQQALLRTPPPLEIHSIRADEKWDPVRNVKVATPSVLLPVPHMTHIFEKVFPFQYSVRQDVGEVHNEVVTSSFSETNGMPRAAGTAYYTTAKYTVELDLGHSKRRVFEGIGTNYTSIGGQGERGAGLVASTATFVQRAALTEAMRNCFDKIGVCFRRGFQDASDQMKILEHILMLELKGLAHEARPKNGETATAFHARIAKRASEVTIARPPSASKVVPAPVAHKARIVPAPKAAPAPKAVESVQPDTDLAKEKVANLVASIRERASNQPLEGDRFISDFAEQASSFHNDGEVDAYLRKHETAISKMNDDQAEKFIEIEASISDRLSH